MKRRAEPFYNWGNKNFLVLIIGIVSFGIYANTILNLLNIDDELIYNNHVLTNIDFPALKNIFTQPYYKDLAGNKYEYRPMVLLSYYFEFLIFGRNPHVSHLLNVLLYTGTCLLLFYLLLSLFKQFEFRQLLSFMVTLLFTVHTIHTEAVASIKNRDELLSLLFAFASWMFAIRFVDSKKIGPFLFFVFFFVAGLLSKQTSIAFSVLVPASLILFRPITFTQLLALIMPIMLVSIILSPVYLLYKKVLLFVSEVIFLIFFYLFMCQREKMVELGRRIVQSIRSFIVITIPKVIKALIHSVGISRSGGFTHIKINSRLLNTTAIVALIVIVAGFFMSKKDKNFKETVKEVEWNVKDKISDFNELQVTPALQAPAPAVVPIAGRRLNFAEVPLLYVNNASIKAGTSIYVLGMYLRLMFIPQPLRFYYGYGLIPLVKFSNITVLIVLFLYLALTALMIYYLFRRQHLIAAFGLLFYLVSIIPLSNILTPIAGIMADRLVYSASLGYCIVLGYLMVYPIFTGQYSSKIVRGFQIFFVLIVITYSFATVARNSKWKDRLTLMRNDIEHLDTSTRAHHLLASQLAHIGAERRQSSPGESKKMLEEAIYHFKRAIEIYPDFPYAWYDMAKAYLLLGEKDSAIMAYSKSTQKDSSFAPSWFEMGVVLGERGKTADAENAYKEAIARDSTLVEAYTNLSYSYFLQGKYQESLEVNLEALKHNPNTYNICVNIGRIYLRLQDIDNGLLFLEKAIAINHSDKAVLKIAADLYQSRGNLERANYYRNLH